MRLMQLTKTALLIAAVGLGTAGRTQAAFITLQNATATFSQTGFPVGAAIDGFASPSTTNGWAIARPRSAFRPERTEAEAAAFETLADAGFAGGTLLTFTLHQLHGSGVNLGRFRLSLTTDDRSQFADGAAISGDLTANWTVLSPLAAMSTGGATLTIQGDDSILASGANPDTDVYTVTASTSLTGITGFRLETLLDSSLPTDGPGRAANGNFVLTEFQVDASPVPEPSSLVVWGLGALGLFGYACRGRKRRGGAGQSR
jgi:hypothetical protein